MDEVFGIANQEVSGVFTHTAKPFRVCEGDRPYIIKSLKYPPLKIPSSNTYDRIVCVSISDVVQFRGAPSAS